MTDKELLELAAFAAGYEIIFKNGLDDDGYDDGVWKYTWIRGQGRLIQWNPLDDDGDALRLAVRLKLPLNFLNRQTARCTPTNKYGNELWVDCGSYWDSSDSMYYPFSEKYGDDPYAATRRAIVRAAAEIGKEMK